MKNFWQNVKKLISSLLANPKNTASISSEHNESEQVQQSVIVMGDKDFAIVFREDRVEAIVPTELDDPDFFSSEDGTEHLDHVESTISYVMHALLREDWKEDYYEAVEEYLKTAPSESEIEALRRRSEFRVITNTDDDKNE